MANAGHHPGARRRDCMCTKLKKLPIVIFPRCTRVKLGCQPTSWKGAVSTTPTTAFLLDK
eukprot:9769605-Karenia_brevis.AAC.1